MRLHSPFLRTAHPSPRKFLGKGRIEVDIRASPADGNSAGYKVGRVDQAETALGAEMRLAADKGNGKKVSGKGGDKIVKRFVSLTRYHSRSLTDNTENYTKCTPTGLSLTMNSSRTTKRAIASLSAKVAGMTKRTCSGFACWTVLLQNSISAHSQTMFAAPSWRLC